MSQPTKLGIVGSGFAARTIGLAAKQLAGAVEVAAVWGGSRARELAALLDVAPAYSIEQLLDSVDAVAIATPHDTHAEFCELALKAGKHVFCEKPFVLDVESGRELIALADSSGLAISVNHFQRYRSPNAAAAVAIRNGRVGKVRGVQCRLFEVPMQLAWQLSSANVGFSIGYGVHATDLLQHLLGRKVLSVTAQSTVDAAGVERSTVAELDFGEYRASLICSDQLNFSSEQVGKAVFEMDIVGERGVIRLDSYGSATLFAEESELLAELPSWTSFDSAVRLEAYQLSLLQFLKSCGNGAEPEITAEQALSAVEVCVAMSASAAQNGALVCV
jgi:predicted dehydrogenase